MAEDKNSADEPNIGLALEQALAEELDERDLEIAKLREEAAFLKDRLLRTAADMDNLRKRAEREKAEATLYAATNFARDLLSVSDNMQRALAHKPAETASEETKNLFAGIEMTERELLNVFQRYNIRKVETVGARFDPNFHQALFEMPTSEYPPGTVVQEMQSGFAIGDRCLRPAMVGVAKAEG
ncbi:MAG: nucleotide exchange factor GrpE [Aestuariivirga sp.]|uniref:nucleotide exchange factor GrpE n=1 Tax=Aestuariivirga sp. TaxID=2650926 RepID=UPI0025BBE786|nr:nucleotide exchange factor GrpE [Aestuariivirga sp.]MCA3560206.1 nucleotide exchange factor GrpE [Aestuariivirga sp.]